MAHSRHWQALAMLLGTSLALPVLAEAGKALRILGAERSYSVQTPAGPIAITRTLTACARNEGFLQPLVPLPGVTPVTEIEVLKALNDARTMVIDVRDEDEPLEVTIPHTFHIPFNEIEDRLDELACSRIAPARWNCAKAPKVVIFCNGPVCPQSSLAIASMVKAGFPVKKIAYYRGGMMDWEALGLTTVSGNRSAKH